MSLFQLSRDDVSRRGAEPDPARRLWYEQFDPGRRLIRGPTSMRLKRGLDLLLCVLASPFLLPAFAVCALLTRLESPGEPCLSTDACYGRSQRGFKRYTFRTTIPNALGAEPGHEPRVTPVGRFLQKSGLSQLPQLINVIKGEMSLVGPRPAASDRTEQPLWHSESLEVVPGIISLWQVVERAEPEADERVRLDIAYIERQSLWFDLNILARRVPFLLKQMLTLSGEERDRVAEAGLRLVPDPHTVGAGRGREVAGRSRAHSEWGAS